MSKLVLARSNVFCNTRRVRGVDASIETDLGERFGVFPSFSLPLSSDDFRLVK